MSCKSVALANFANFSLRRDCSAVIIQIAKLVSSSHIIILNLGEINASPDAWKMLLVALADSSIGHLYISESQLSAVEKQLFITTIRSNRLKDSYKGILQHSIVRDLSNSFRLSWWNPKICLS
jgi:hypothetical protein